jgi:hypothetical protein
VTRNIDLGRERAIEVERDEQALGASEFAQADDQFIGLVGLGAGLGDVTSRG